MASSYVLDQLLSYPGRSTRALVDLDAIRDNARLLKAHVGASVELMAVVKADGYGHGAVYVAREAIAGGATWLGVATVSEGHELRVAGYEQPILVLGPIHGSEIDAAFTVRLDVTVGDESLAAEIVARAASAAPLPRLHLKVDTGMHRYGLSPEQALAVLERLSVCSAHGVFALSSHLASADDPSATLTARQDREFRELAERAQRISPGLGLHLANSAGSLSGLARGTQIARTGIALYGCGLPLEDAETMGIRPAMSIVSRLLRIHELKTGESVGYGQTYVAHSRERVGLVPIGYGDGYIRSLSNNSGRMSVRNAMAPVRGRVSMDQTVIGDLTKDAEHGDWVGVVGPALNGPRWDDLARLADTISYELLSSVARRVPRLYHRAGQLVAVRDELGEHTDISEHENAPAAKQQRGHSRNDR